MSVPHTVTTLKKNEDLRPALSTPASGIDIDMIEAVSKVAENPTPRGCVVLDDMAKQRQSKVKLPPVCERFLESIGRRRPSPDKILDGGGPE